MKITIELSREQWEGLNGLFVGQIRALEDKAKGPRKGTDATPGNLLFLAQALAEMNCQIAEVV
jgi:hypothetical protein